MAGQGNRSVSKVWLDLSIAIILPMNDFFPAKSNAPFNLKVSLNYFPFDVRTFDEFTYFELD